MGKVPVISHRRNFFPSFTNFTSYNGSHTWCMAMMSAEDFVLPHFYAFCQPFLSRWLLLFNSLPIVYFFHYVAVFAELRRFHGSHLPIQMNWWDWCNKNCGAKKKSRGSFFSLHIFCFSEKKYGKSSSNNVLWRWLCAFSSHPQRVIGKCLCTKRWAQ